MDAESIMRKVDRRNKTASKQEVRGILRDLVQMVTEVDPSGSSRDYSKRKSFVYYDPYNPDKSTSFAHLRYEDDEKMRASLIIQSHHESLADIEKQIRGQRSSVADKQRFDHIKLMLDRLNDMKIVDPQVLLKLYDMYRYDLNEQGQAAE